jgi:hypothetical protein
VVTQALFDVGHSTSLDLIYARGVHGTPTPDPTSFDRMQSFLLIVEIEFFRDLGCDDKIVKTQKKTPP